ncbi:hypothetical protein CERSUDRAFT_127602 [Gelatoporia subvermispora B]|uniref:DUF6534 domain-containing protein n=1 Tax=Ceriporiopsis subvermispora (strain B) TaxID=914234 RepID=M2Q2X4_CERS8|nr:hypothetical protein CERSUDRAFT_127602 [Gelatoporia subvermispora B]
MSSTEHSHTMDGTLGAFLVGLVAASLLYGITNVQTRMYYKMYEADRLILRIAVGFLWTLDTIHQALAIHTVYTYVVIRYGDPEALETPTWSVMANIVVTSLNDTIVRTLFCHRLWKFSEKNYYITAPTMLAAITSLVGGIIYTVKGVPLGSFARLSALTCWLYIGFTSGAVADILLASSLVIYLWRSRTGLPRTDSLVQLLILFTVNSGVLTSACEIMCIVTYSVLPKTFWYYALYMILPKVHLNSLLASYNARHEMREAAFGPEDRISFALVDISYADTGRLEKHGNNEASLIV